jgi:hypothetical protein
MNIELPGIELPDRWIDFLIDQPETGMGYQIVSVVLNDSNRYDRVVIDSGRIIKVYGYDHIPFRVEDIKEMIVTHDKWKFHQP